MTATAPVEYLTVEEVAIKLMLSVATVRRRCARGDWGAVKVGKQWLVPAGSLAGAKLPPRPGKSRTSASFDIETALRHVQSKDMTELWVPDVVRYRDRLDDPKTLASEAGARLVTSEFHAAREVVIPKTPYSGRPGVLLELVDRVSYQAVVASMATAINGHMLDVVYSCRPSSDPKYFLENGPKRYVRFESETGEKAEKQGGWVAKADLAAYFEHINHDILFRELSGVGIGGDALRNLRDALSKWAIVPGRGLPQGPNASRVLGNFYLAEVDHEMIDNGHDYVRYMDDIRIFAPDKAAAVSALRELEMLCRRRGLTLSSTKTTVLSAFDYSLEAVDLAAEQAAYSFDSGDLPSARKELRELLRSALSAKRINVRRVRFSMWRLARIRESTVLGQVLANLEVLAPVASLVAAFLTHFVNRRRVQDGITEFMNDASSSYSYYLRAWIFAVMLECRTVPADWRRIADVQVKDKNTPDYVRALAACVLAKARVSRDLSWIRSEFLREHDPNMLRSYVVALKYGNALDRSISSECKGNPDLERLVGWLRPRTSLPSLTYPDRQISL